MRRPFTLVFIGPSGSGKGTQVRLLLHRLKNVYHIETGALLRRFAKKHTITARRAREIMLKGRLVPSWLAFYIWLDEFARKVKKNQDAIFDGSPRKLIEAQFLDEVMHWYGRPLPIAVSIWISPKETRKRLLLRSRSDDTISSIRSRLRYFKRDVLPTIAYYRKHGRLVRINGEQSVGEVARDIRKALKI